MAKENQPVTEYDLRAEEFKRPDIKPEDYEFREDGKIVRKDRWLTAVCNLAAMMGNSRSFEIPELMDDVRSIIEFARFPFPLDESEFADYDHFDLKLVDGSILSRATLDGTGTEKQFLWQGIPVSPDLIEAVRGSLRKG